MDFGVKYAQEKLWAVASGAAWFAVGGILNFGVRLKETCPWSLELQGGAPGLGDGCFGAPVGLAVLPTCCHAVPASLGALGMQAVQRARDQCDTGMQQHPHPPEILLLVLQAAHKIRVV